MTRRDRRRAVREVARAHRREYRANVARIRARQALDGA